MKNKSRETPTTHHPSLRRHLSFGFLATKPASADKRLLIRLRLSRSLTKDARSTTRTTLSGTRKRHVLLSGLPRFTIDSPFLIPKKPAWTDGIFHFAPRSSNDLIPYCNTCFLSRSTGSWCSSKKWLEGIASRFCVNIYTQFVSVVSLNNEMKYEE